MLFLDNTEIKEVGIAVRILEILIILTGMENHNFEQKELIDLSILIEKTLYTQKLYDIENNDLYNVLLRGGIFDYGIFKDENGSNLLILDSKIAESLKKSKKEFLNKLSINKVSFMKGLNYNILLIINKDKTKTSKLFPLFILDIYNKIIEGDN